MSKRDYYEVLGVSQNADKSQLKKAYRKLARKFHPDVNKEADAADKFKEINAAYEVLSDDQKKAAYDRYGHAAFENGGGPQDFGQGFGGFADIFEEVFGGFASGGMGGSRRRRNAPRRGGDLRYDLEIDFMDAVFGTEKVIEITRMENCHDCSGSGSAPGSQPATCPECNGAGELRQNRQTILGTMVNVVSCPRCSGNGRIVVNPCNSCSGRGQIQATKPLSVKIPAGVDNEMQMRLTGEGAPGVNGGPPGNLFIVMHVTPHEYFQRRGDDVYLSLDINITQAVLGDEINVPTVDGSENLSIPSGTQPGTKFTLRARGVPRVKRSGRGDQHILVQVAIPRKLSDHQQELFLALGETLGKEVIPQPERGFFSTLKDTFGDWFN